MVDHLSFENLVRTIQEADAEKTIVIAHATDISLYYAAKKAMDQRLASFIFTGPGEKMDVLMKEAELSSEYEEKITFVETHDVQESAEKAVQLIHEGRAHVLMKGMLSTSVLLKAVLNKQTGLRTGKILSHVAGFSLPEREKLLFITDAAMNIKPDLNEKAQIIQNTVEALKGIGVFEPKVAAIAAVETVNPVMEATLDAAALTQMNRRGQITDCIVDGPLGFDNAVSIEAADQKGIKSDVAGRADVILVPQIETGNVLYKSLTYFGSATVGGIIVGAKVPVILTSRSDSVKSKLFSIAMGVGSSSIV